MKKVGFALGLSSNHVRQRVTYILIIGILFIVSQHSISQTKSFQDDVVSYHPKKYNTYFDLLLGPSFIYPGGSELFKDKRVLKIGYSGGLSFRRNINTKLEFGLMVLYENKGLKAKYEYLNTAYNPPIVEQSLQNIDLNYLTLTSLLRYYFESEIFVGLGPYFGYLLSERIRITTYQNGVVVNQSGSRPNPYLNYKRFDFGFCGTVGYSVRIKKREAGYIQINYNSGLISVNQPSILEVRNSTYSILLAFHLRSTKFN